MSKDTQQEADRKRAGSWILLILVILLLLYVLSPPIVVETVGVDNYGDYCTWLYWPLVRLSHSSELVRNWYASYFEFFPSDYWDAWYLGPEFFDQMGGFGKIEQIRAL